MIIPRRSGDGLENFIVVDKHQSFAKLEGTCTNKAVVHSVTVPSLDGFHGCCVIQLTRRVETAVHGSQTVVNWSNKDTKIRSEDF